MMVPSVSVHSSVPSGYRFLTVWSGYVISLRPSGNASGQNKVVEKEVIKYNNEMFPSNLTSLVVGELQNLDAVRIGGVRGLGISIVVDL